MDHFLNYALGALLFSIVAVGLWSCVDNVNEPTVEDQEFEVDENASAGTIIGVVAAFDMDPGQTISYRILEGNEEGIFAIDEVGGHLSVADPSYLDYETIQQFTLTVLVSDDGEPSKESRALITISLRDVNEFSPVIEDQRFDLAADAPAGTVVGTLVASDPEPQQGILFTLRSGNEAGIFGLAENSGELRVEDASALASASSPLILTVLVRDIHIDSRSSTATVTVHLTTK
jgi:hypothetical protein